MNRLLAEILSAHGGLARWNGFEAGHSCIAHSVLNVLVPQPKRRSLNPRASSLTWCEGRTHSARLPLDRRQRLPKVDR
jgi:hypothetical protein